MWNAAFLDKYINIINLTLTAYMIFIYMYIFTLVDDVFHRVTEDIKCLTNPK